MSAQQSEPAAGPALLFVILAMFAVCTKLACTVADATEMAEKKGSETAEDACARIRSDLRELAKAERAQAFALDLAAGQGGSEAIIETRLAAVLDRTNRLRRTLREVRHRAAPHDPRVEQCTRMGFQALVEAEKLTTNVEELLHNRENAESSGPIRSDAQPAGPVPQP